MDKEVNERLKRSRELLNIPQKQASKDLGVRQSFLSDIENSRRPISEKLLDRFSTTFNVSKTWLTTGEGSIFLQKKGTELYPLNVPHHVPNSVPKSTNSSSLEGKRIIFERKLIDYLNKNPDIKQLGNDAIEILGFEYILGIITNKYLSYLHLNSTSEETTFEEQKEVYYKYIEKLRPFKEPLSNLSSAIRKFYREMYEAGEEMFDFASDY